MTQLCLFRKIDVDDWFRKDWRVIIQILDFDHHFEQFEECKSRDYKILDIYPMPEHILRNTVFENPSTQLFFIQVFFRNTRFLPPHLTIQWTKKRLFLTNENWRWHLLVELSYLFFEKARIKGHPLLFWIFYDFNHSKLTKIRAESTKVDHIRRVWRTLSRVFRPITAYSSIFRRPELEYSSILRGPSPSQ